MATIRFDLNSGFDGTYDTDSRETGREEERYPRDFFFAFGIRFREDCEVASKHAMRHTALVRAGGGLLLCLFVFLVGSWGAWKGYFPLVVN